MRTLLVAIACISTLSADARKWKLHPALDTAVEQVKIGELTSIRGTAPVVGASDGQSRGDYLKAQKAHDKEGIEELAGAGKIASLPPGTELRVLERDEADLDKLMDAAHQLADSDYQIYKSCLEGNIRRTRVGLRLQSCGDFSFTDSFNSRTSDCLGNSTPEAFVDSHVLVLVRVLSGKESGKKLWVLFETLARPSVTPN